MFVVLYSSWDSARKPIKYSQTVLAHLEYLTGFLIHTHKFIEDMNLNEQKRSYILKHFLCNMSSVSQVIPLVLTGCKFKICIYFFNFIEKQAGLYYL